MIITIYKLMKKYSFRKKFYFLNFHHKFYNGTPDILSEKRRSQTGHCRQTPL